MRLATWNVNSIRSRIDRVSAWLERSDVDVLAMQETKCTDAQFPTMPFAALGYDVAHVGHNQWNGVAIASRVGLEDVTIGFDGQPEWNDAVEARAIGATCGGVRMWSLYVPNGRTIEDPHYQYKLEWLAALHNTSASWLAAEPDAAVALTGDWNIAPTDDDVWDVEFFRGATHVTEPERAAFRAIEAQFADVVRPYAPPPGNFTYWDYTQLRFPKRQGMRIDFALGSPALAARVTHAAIDRDERKPGKKGTPAPSDHAPVLFELSDG